MTKEDFENAVSAFDDAEAFICAAHVDGELAIAVKGPIEAIIVGAVQVIVDNAERSNDTIHHLVTASSLLHSAMLIESQRRKDAAKIEEKEIAPKAAATAPGARVY